MMTNNLIDSKSFHTDNQTFMAHEWVEIDVMIKTTRWYKLSCFHHDMGHMCLATCLLSTMAHKELPGGATIRCT